MSVLIDCRYEQNAISNEEIAALINATLNNENIDIRHEVSVAFIGQEEIAQLNEEYRNKPFPTDVLSFEIDDPYGDYGVDEVAILGDIIISPEVAFGRSKDYGTTPKEELALLIVHGTLHLLGYDHQEESEASIMETKEREILASLGYKSQGYNVL